jgi:hypothetical protein
MKKILMLLGCAFLTYSCDLVCPIDDIKPQYKLTEETTFSDATKCEAALNGVYSGWRSSGIGNYLCNTLMLSGNYEPISAGGAGSDLFENRPDFDDEGLNSYYSDYYEIIQRANFLIKALQSDLAIIGLTAERRVEMEGEARLQRAMVHFFLLRSFGQFYDMNSDLGIVVRKEPLSEPGKYPRSTVKQVYDFIFEDLDYAIENAPMNAGSGFLSRFAAKAMKTKVLLYTGKWEEASVLASEVINSGVYELKSDFRAIYQEGYKSREVIFSPISNAYINAVVSPGSSNNNPSQLLKSVADKSVGSPSDGNILTGAGYDPRFAYAHATSTLQAGIYNNKYPFLQADGQQAGSHFILRLGELYLIYAEAKARLATGTAGNSEFESALGMLNIIRERAGLIAIAPATKAELLEAIRIEKVLELFGEFNEPWFDMVRYHILGDLNISDLRPNIIGNDQLILPFPTKALAGNGGLVQNPIRY